MVTTEAAEAECVEMSDRIGRKKPLRVLMVTGAYHPEMSSSAIQCREMARLLTGRVETHVLTTAVDPTLGREDAVDGVGVTRVLVNVNSALSKLRATLRMLWELLRLVPNSDIVHLHGFSTKNVLVTAVAKVLQRPVVLSLHTSGHDEAETIRRHGSLAWWAFSRADSYLSVSPSLLDAYLAAGLPPDRIHLVPNGIDLQRFSPADASARVALRAALGLPQELPIVLFVGFFSRDKQPRVLFDAWQRTRERHDSMLVFVGATRSAYFEVDDDLAGGMQDDARRGGFGDRVCFAGPSERVEDYFRAADVFALPSRREGLPVALLEAMACELPCVASRLPGSTDTIIDDGANGLLVPPGDVAAFAAAVDRILSAPSFGAALGANARATVVSRFANVDVADLWLDAYDRLGVTRA